MVALGARGTMGCVLGNFHLRNVATVPGMLRWGRRWCGFVAWSGVPCRVCDVRRSGHGLALVGTVVVVFVFGHLGTSL